jgi:hypothetical protein
LRDGYALLHASGKLVGIFAGVAVVKTDLNILLNLET